MLVLFLENVELVLMLDCLFRLDIDDEEEVVFFFWIWKDFGELGIVEVFWVLIEDV